MFPWHASTQISAAITEKSIFSYISANNAGTP